MCDPAILLAIDVPGYRPVLLLLQGMPEMLEAQVPTSTNDSSPSHPRAFICVAMDIVGPFPRSHSGNRYVLVLCDYSTRYPEAVPLKNVDAETVAEELVTIFS